MIRSFFISFAEGANWVIGRKSPDKKILSWKVVFANFPQKDDDLRVSLNAKGFSIRIVMVFQELHHDSSCKLVSKRF